MADQSDVNDQNSRHDAQINTHQNQTSNLGSNPTNSNNTDNQPRNRRNQNSDTQTDEQRAERRRQRQQRREAEMHELEIKHKAADVVSLIIPVSICMFLTVVMVKTIPVAGAMSNIPTLYTPISESTASSTSDAISAGLINSLSFAVFVCIMTYALFLCFKYKCMVFLYIWIGFTMIMCMFTLSGKLFRDFIKQYNLGIDIFTFGILLFNFGVIGLMSLAWKVPKRLNQFYSIVLGVLMTYVFIQILPEWSGWLILFVVSVWDLIAVLCPYGALRMLVEEAQERGERNIMPALIYSAMAYQEIEPRVEQVDGDGATVAQQEERPLSAEANIVTNQTTQNTTEETVTRPNNNNQSRPNQQEIDDDDEEENGVRLGLGDFIFYSLLVAKAAVAADYTVTFACYVSILLGLSATLVLLAITKHALPALPISIFLGLITYFCGEYLVKPFLDEVMIKGVVL